MRKIVYIFIFAVVLLVFKAFFLDEYLERYYNKETNTTSAETNISSEAVQTESEPEVNATLKNSDTSAAEREKNISSEKPEMPLEKLGDEFSKHIKL